MSSHLVDLDKIKKEELRAEKIAQVIKDNEKFTKIKHEYGEEVIIKHTDAIIPINPKDLTRQESELGEHKFIIKYKFDGEELELKYALIIEDTTAPVIKGVKNIEIEVDKDLDFKSLGISAHDNIDGDLELNFDSDFENKAGDYIVKVSAKDSSGNETIEEFSIKVNEKRDLIAAKDDDSNSKQHNTSQASPEKPKDVKPPNKSKPAPTTQAKPKPKPEPKTQPKPKPQIEYLDNWARDMHNAVNAERKKAGLEPYQWSDRIHRSAKVRAKEITVSFSHTRPDDSQWYTADDEVLFGENIAYGQNSVADAVSAFMNSPGHRANILNENHETAAYGVVSFDGTYY